MTSNYNMIIEGANAQDLFFIEREVRDTKVLEQPTQVGKTSFGMPGVIEAVILITASGAVTAAIAWVLKNRKTGHLIIEHTEKPNGTITEKLELEWNESESSEKTIEKVEKWLAGFENIAGTMKDG
jgi:hypothetical protein